jgi:hypothetical protein
MRWYERSADRDGCGPSQVELVSPSQSSRGDQERGRQYRQAELFGEHHENNRQVAMIDENLHEAVHFKSPGD